MAALDRAVALAEVDRVAVPVGEHLDLDVARVGQVALEVDGGVGEELLALARGALEGGLQLFGLQGDAKALAAAAARRLDGHGVADLLVGDLRGVLERGDGLDRAGHDRHAGRLHELAGAGLGSHRVDRARGRADEHDAGLRAGPRERGVLGEKAVPGVDGLGARLAHDLEDPLDVQIRLGRLGRTQEVGLTGAGDVRRVAVELGVDGDRGDPELVERADDADRDLAAVGNEDFREH